MDLTQFSVEQLQQMKEDYIKQLSNMVVNPEAVIMLEKIEKEIKTRN